MICTTFARLGDDYNNYLLQFDQARSVHVLANLKSVTICWIPLAFVLGHLFSLTLYIYVGKLNRSEMSAD